MQDLSFWVTPVAIYSDEAVDALYVLSRFCSCPLVRLFFDTNLSTLLSWCNLLQLAYLCENIQIHVCALLTWKTFEGSTYWARFWWGSPILKAGMTFFRPCFLESSASSPADNRADFRSHVCCHRKGTFDTALCGEIWTPSPDYDWLVIYLLSVTSTQGICPEACSVWERRTDGRTDGRRDQRTDKRIDGWTDNRTDGQTDGRTDGRTPHTFLTEMFGINYFEIDCTLTPVDWFSVFDDNPWSETY